MPSYKIKMIKMIILINQLKNLIINLQNQLNHYLIKSNQIITLLIKIRIYIKNRFKWYSHYLDQITTKTITIK